MISRFVPYLILLVSVLGSITLTEPLHHIRVEHNRESLSGLGRMPPRLLQAMALNYEGVAADFLFLKTVTYVGMKLIERTDLTAEEWRKVGTMLQGVTDLDERFLDPYLFAEAMFPWQPGMLPEADALLEKAAQARPNDYLPLYYLGFNAFYFEKDAAKAAPYLRKAAALPGAPEFLLGLAARFSLYGHETEAGIAFLQNMLATTNDAAIRSYLGKRLKALQIIDGLEHAVMRYKQRYGTLPSSVDELVQKRVIDSLPMDPYGGKFVILPNGRVYTSSNLVASQKEKTKQ
jgi:tetratricopeptide (TPR) repeat protein